MPEKESPVAIVPVSEDMNEEALKIAQNLRLAGFRVEQGYSGNIKKRMIKADKMMAKAAVIVGSDEIAQGKAVIKNLKDGQQKIVNIDRLAEELK